MTDIHTIANTANFECSVCDYTSDEYGDTHTHRSRIAPDDWVCAVVACGQRVGHEGDHVGPELPTVEIDE